MVAFLCVLLCLGLLPPGWMNVPQSAGTGAAPLQTADTETLAVTSTPDGAEVYLDDNLFGNTPATLKVAAGRHTLRVVLAGYRPWTRTILAQPGAEAHLLASLDKATPGTVTGRTLWNDEPVGGVRVLLRQFGPSPGNLGSATSDDQGRFTIANVPDSSGYYLDVTSNQPMFSSDSMVPVEIGADGAPAVRDIFVCKPLTGVSPTLGQTISGHHVKISWQPLPEAAGYSIRVWRIRPERPYDEVYSRGNMLAPQLASSDVQLDADLPMGQYFWRVDAFNSARHIIGCSFYPETFTVTKD